MKQLAISYGFLGGKLVSSTYKQMAARHGFELTENLVAADVILAHSAGCWRLPEQGSSSLLILVGMPLQHDDIHQTFALATRNNRRLFKANHHLRLGLKIFTLSTLYGIFQPRRNYRIMRAVQTTKPFPQFPNAKHIVFIAGKDDPYPNSPELAAIVHNNPRITFLSMTGSHQDIWEYPERYLGLIQSEL